MKTSKSNKKRNTREIVKVSISELYQAVGRLQSEMAILYHLHKEELDNMQKIHDEIAEQVAKKAEEAARDHVEKELLTQNVTEEVNDQKQLTNE